MEEMKKILSLIIALVLCMSLCACGSNQEEAEETKATIVDDNGNTYSLSSSELKEIENSNEAQFDSIYCGADISFVGTVKKVETYFRRSGSSTVFDSISFEEGWKVYLLHDYNKDFIVNLSVGDKVKVESQIFGYDVGYIEVMGMNGEGYTNSSLTYTDLTLVN